MSYILMFEERIQIIKLITKVRAASMPVKMQIIADCKTPDFFKRYYFFNDKELADHLLDLEKEQNKIINRVNINQAYEH